MTIEITFPWPPRQLSPNTPIHWAAKAKIKAAYRQECRIVTTNTLFPIRPSFHDGKIHLFIDFFPPDKRRRDDDNCYASFKSGRDGLAEALGVDDHRFVSHPYLQDEVIKGGQVRVRITQVAP